MKFVAKQSLLTFFDCLPEKNALKSPTPFFCAMELSRGAPLASALLLLSISTVGRRLCSRRLYFRATLIVSNTYREHARCIERATLKRKNIHKYILIFVYINIYIYIYIYIYKYIVTIYIYFCMCVCVCVSVCVCECVTYPILYVCKWPGIPANNCKIQGGLTTCFVPIFDDESEDPEE